MTNFNYFAEWAWGHIDDYYQNEKDTLISDVRDFSILKFISECAQEALEGLDVEEQEEMFGFTLEQILKGELLDSFYYNEILKEYS